MLPHLDLYMLVGLPSCIVHIILERDRITWLEALVLRRLPFEEAQRVIRWLELYFWSLVVGTLGFGFLIRIHIDIALPHYICSFTGLAGVTLAMAVYLVAPIDFDALGKGCDDGEAWASQVQRWVKTMLRLVLALTALCFASALWKCEGLGDDRRSLVFGVLETATIVGYQFVLGAMVVDDWRMSGGGVTPSIAIDGKEKGA